MEIFAIVVVILAFYGGMTFLRSSRGPRASGDGKDWCGPPPRDPRTAGSSSFISRLWQRLRT